MCGIFGFIDREKTLTNESADALAQGLAVAAMDRGEDASGYAILQNGSIEIVKKAVPANELAIESRGSYLLIGHTRFATMGDPCADSQAHPFYATDKSFALTHNGVGTIDFQRLLKKRPELASEIDSQAITKFIEMSGLGTDGLYSFIRAWKSSSIAIAILRAESESIILFRNDRNPIVIAETKNGTLVYGSTVEIVETGCLTAELEIERIGSLPPFERHEFFLDGRISTSQLTAPVKKAIGF